MATQSLYRRYRPRRFSELRGQEHVVRALRTSVAEGRAGQAYLFSGPRGTGKTTSARILAKVLNCTNPIDGEPCCECDSCVAVERGTSYDVHELDAASNNGVDAMRDLIDKASLGTPGRHKVYILDEVHMLSNAAEAALLKTLEEPPPHVVFVLATTDPQKMSDTVRSRTQHLQFHLLPPDTLADHVRWVAEDAGLTIDDDAVSQVIARGGGSARDTLSALELVANTGGSAGSVMDVGQLIDAMIDRDPGAALRFVGAAVNQGLDPRALAEEIVAQLRNGFLALMAPEMVLLPAAQVEALGEQARRLGAAGLVRGIEVFGAILVEMRHAPNPRVLVDVAVVQLTADSAATDVAGLAARLDRLERQIADGTVVAAPVAPTTAAPADAQPPTTSASPAAASDGDASSTAQPAGSDAAPRRATIGGRVRRNAGDAPAAEPAGQPAAVAEAPPASSPTPAAAPAAPAPAPAAAAGGPSAADVWDEVRPKLRGLARPLFTSVDVVSGSSTELVLRAPSSTHRNKCEQHRPAVEAALADRLGHPVAVALIDPDGAGGAAARSTSGGPGSGSSGGPGQPAPNQPGPGRSGSDQPGSGPAGSVSAGSGSAGSGPVASAQSGSGGASAVSSVPAASTSSAGANALATSPAAPDPMPTPASEPAVADPYADVPPPSADPYDDVPPPTIEHGSEAYGDDGMAPAAAASHTATSASTSVPPSVPTSTSTSAEFGAAESTAPQALPDDDEIDLDDLVDAPPESYKSPLDRLAEAFPGSVLVERHD